MTKEQIEALAKKFASQTGDDVQEIYSHEALFKHGVALARTALDALAEVERLRGALMEIAEPVAIRVPTGEKGGVNFKALYKQWRKMATARIDIARAAIGDKGADE